MMSTPVTRPMMSTSVARPMVAGGMTTAGAIWFGGGCFPFPGYNPWDIDDSELERLRRLERDARREQEKEAIRRRLRQMGVPEERIAGWPLFPCLPNPFPSPLPVYSLHRAPRVPSLEEIIRQAQKGSRAH